MRANGPHHIGTKGAADGNVLVYRKATDEYGPEVPPASGVATVVAGAGVTVDSTDPAHPIVSSTAPAQLVGLTTEIGGVPGFVWDDDNQQVMTEAN